MLRDYWCRTWPVPQVLVLTGRHAARQPETRNGGISLGYCKHPKKKEMQEPKHQHVSLPIFGQTSRAGSR